jgi:hypothetical protein
VNLTVYSSYRVSLARILTLFSEDVKTTNYKIPISHLLLMAAVSIISKSDGRSEVCVVAAGGRFVLSA